MVAVRDQVARPITADTATRPTIRRIGLVPSDGLLSRRGAPYLQGMVAARDQVTEPITAGTATPPTIRRIGLVPSASMIVGAAIATVLLWLYLMIVVVGLWLVPSVIGFAVALLAFVYLMRGVEWLERRRS